MGTRSTAKRVVSQRELNSVSSRIDGDQFTSSASRNSLIYEAQDVVPLLMHGALAWMYPVFGLRAQILVGVTEWLFEALALSWAGTQLSNMSAPHVPAAKL